MAVQFRALVLRFVACGESRSRSQILNELHGIKGIPYVNSVFLSIFLLNIDRVFP